MPVKSKIFRLRKLIRHQLTAWNTGGEGVHSPTLFYLVRMIVYDDNAYYAYSQIEQQRAALLRRSDVPKPLTSAKTGQLLFRLTNYLGSNSGKALTIVEAGHLPDISSAYLAAPAERNTVLSYETLPRKLPKHADLAYLHTPDSEAALAMFRQLLPAFSDHSIVVVSGIHCSPQAEQTWQAIQAMQQVTSTLDLFDVGIVLFNRHYIRKHYKLRF